jgi:hypothetical protein
MELAWAFPAIEVSDSGGTTGIVRRLHWTLTASHNNVTARTYGICDLGDPGPDFVPLESLNDTIMYQWLADRHDVPAIVAGISDEIERLRNEDTYLVVL